MSTERRNPQSEDAGEALGILDSTGAVGIGLLGEATAQIPVTLPVQDDDDLDDDDVIDGEAFAGLVLDADPAALVRGDDGIGRIHQGAGVSDIVIEIPASAAEEVVVAELVEDGLASEHDEDSGRDDEDGSVAPPIQEASSDSEPLDESRDMVDEDPDRGDPADEAVLDEVPVIEDVIDEQVVVEEVTDDDAVDEDAVDRESAFEGGIEESAADDAPTVEDLVDDGLSDEGSHDDSLTVADAADETPADEDAADEDAADGGSAERNDENAIGESRIDDGTADEVQNDSAAFSGAPIEDAGADLVADDADVAVEDEKAPDTVDENSEDRLPAEAPAAEPALASHDADEEHGDADAAILDAPERAQGEAVASSHAVAEPVVLHALDTADAVPARAVLAAEAAVEEHSRAAAPGITARRLDQLGDRERESADLLTADRLLDHSRLADPEPEGLWSHLVYTVSGRRINLGDGKRALQRKALSARIAAPLSGTARFVPVLSRKGGVGKTTVTALLGMALADAREDRVIAVDANPDRGTLADRIARTNSKTVRDLVRIHDQVTGYHDISAVVSRDATRLDVLASDADPHVSEAFSDEDYDQVASVAAHYYSLVLTDTGTGIVHSVMGATLDRADTLVIVAGLSVDEARLASETLTWLEANGYADKVREAVVVLNQSTPGAPMVRLDELEAHFRSRVAHVLRLPYDARIAAGSAITFAALQPETRQAARELAAIVVEGLRAQAA